MACSFHMVCWSSSTGDAHHCRNWGHLRLLCKAHVGGDMVPASCACRSSSTGDVQLFQKLWWLGLVWNAHMDRGAVLIRCVCPLQEVANCCHWDQGPTKHAVWEMWVRRQYYRDLCWSSVEGDPQCQDWCKHDWKGQICGRVLVAAWCKQIRYCQCCACPHMWLCVYAEGWRM